MTEATNIVSLRGEEIAPHGSPQPEAVELAQEILERALAGEVVAISVVLYHADEAVSSRHAGIKTYRQIGCLEALKVAMVNDLLG